ncbi:SGNH/GDSL hydrolase family protein [Hyalangium rubrum]|uniref:SGNH/GDSL hydrolase family protein n=1 Tax=Hyalangium rubrum TaxID=3103134 RepID=A0ABU5HBZ8_9BACT|nr:SGNH/GDSL hydrolase family protein [Hyalangium sp. s54d21]MDY7229615.1 SGNH/GDSL hydrolase family protein [Hyalangium sp. s54d21]
MSLLSLGLWSGCGPGAEDVASPDPSSDAEPPAWVEDSIAPVPPPLDGLEVAPPLVLHEREEDRPTPPRVPAISFQPGFHQALRWSHSVGSLTTFRMRIPIGRAGDRLRVTFRSGDSGLTLQKATVAHAGPSGALASAPVPITFSGSSGFSVGARVRVTSDPIDFPVGFRDELYVSFEVKGALSVSAINAFPGSFARSGAHASTPSAIGGASWQRAIGVATIDVEGPTGRVFLALGDSITEGYIDTYNDMRNAWPTLVQAQLGVPVINAGVSGQGFWGALDTLDQEVLALSGVTDCLILLGTNDLSAVTDEQLQARMTRLLDRLQPFCQPWVSTLLPKEKSNHGNYEVVKASRLVFNAWVREQKRAHVIDLEAVTRQPNNIHLFIDGLEVDGIHPSAEGHRVMAAEATRVLRDNGL